MTDRELLEAAARAAGYQINAARQAERDRDYPEQVGLWINDESTCWNPLIDSGHALRLAVKLEIEVRNFNGCSHAGQKNKFWCTERWFPDGDPYAATRRAIVRAAASLATAAKGETP